MIPVLFKHSTRDKTDTTRRRAIFGVGPGEVTHEQRSKAKTVSDGLAYGMESYGLSQRLGIGVDEASGILRQYFEAFPKVRAYMDDTVVAAKACGYTERNWVGGATCRSWPRTTFVSPSSRAPSNECRYPRPCRRHLQIALFASMRPSNRPV